MLENNFFDDDRESILPDLTPLIDVIFILVVFFLLTPSISERSIDVSLPSYKSAAETAQNKIIIDVDSSNNIYFCGVKSDAEQIKNILKGLRQVSAEAAQEQILIRSDSKSSFGIAVALMDIISESGFSSVSFAVTDLSGRN